MPKVKDVLSLLGPSVVVGLHYLTDSALVLAILKLALVLASVVLILSIILHIKNKYVIPKVSIPTWKHVISYINYMLYGIYFIYLGSLCGFALLSIMVTSMVIYMELGNVQDHK
jgi:hypothetical protein